MEEELLSIGFDKHSEHTFYYYLDRGRKIIVDINVISIDGYRNAVYIKQGEDYCYLTNYNIDNINTLIHIFNN